MAELNWNDAQWQKVNDAVTEGFNKASVAGQFLPMYGPLSGSAEVVRNERLEPLNGDAQEYGSAAGGNTIKLSTTHDSVNLRLLSLRVNVELSSEQVNDEQLANAMLAFRRASSVLALEQDKIVFGGFRRDVRKGERSTETNVFISNQDGLAPQKGLADPQVSTDFQPLDPETRADGDIGASIVPAVAEAISTLEARSHAGPFACVLANGLFQCAHTPNQGSLVLPADRIVPQLSGGLLLRSGGMPKDLGVVVSLAGGSVDIVVGAPPAVQFLQRQPDAKYLFRVVTRFVLRIRDNAKPPYAGFKLLPAADQAPVPARKVLRRFGK